MTKLAWMASHPPSVATKEREEKQADTLRQPGGDGQHAENLRRMLLAMAEDLRVVFIKLADRLHNMRTLGALPAERRKRIAQEPLDIFAPLADRVGMWETKWQLEDLAFRYLEPRAYQQVARQLAHRSAPRDAFIERFTEKLMFV